MSSVLLPILAFTTLLSLSQAGVLYQSSFTSSLSPFSVCNVKTPSYAAIEDGHLKTFFDEANFDGTRNDKGVEICVFRSGTTTNVYQMQKEGWQGFKVYVPSSPGFPTNKETIIAQQFCPGGCSSWCGEITLGGNSIIASHRAGGCVTPTTTTIVSSVQRDVWHDVVVRMKVSKANLGAYEFWWDGNLVYSKKNINVGFGDWTGDVLSSGWYFKNGQYAFDTENYDDATRTLLFDDVKWYETDSGEEDGYATVAP